MSSRFVIATQCVRRRLTFGSGLPWPSTELRSFVTRKGVDQHHPPIQSSIARSKLFVPPKFTSSYKQVSNCITRMKREISVVKKLSTQALSSTFSTMAMSSATNTSLSPESGQIIVEPTAIQPSIVQSADGRQFAAFELPKIQRKLKPYIVKRRLDRMRTFIGKQKNIRHSPWRMNLVCQFAAGKTLTDAIQQLTFCRKSMAPLVQKVLVRTANVADMKHGLQQSQLEVAECFATKGKPLKRSRIMGRGRAGRMEHKHSHFRVVIREIDFKLRIYQAATLGEKKRWFLRQQQAEADFAKTKAERDEIVRLEKETEAYRKKETKK
jgi:large subunit ribosomal protein L22